MSIKAIQAVLDESQHKGSALLLMVVLANYAHDDGTYAFPSVNTMTRYTRLTRRNVQLLLRKLEKSGELVEMGIHNSGTVIYRLVLPGLTEGGVKFTPPKKRGAKPASAGGDQEIAGGASPATPDPSSNHQQPSEDHYARRVEELAAVFPFRRETFDITRRSYERTCPDPARRIAALEEFVARAKAESRRRR